MAVKEQTPEQTAMKAMWDAKDRMKAKCGGIGEPGVHLPTEGLRTYLDDDGELQVIMGITDFVHLVDRVLRS